GTVVRDEVHEDFQYNYRMDTNMQTPFLLNLSATIETSNKQLQKFYWQLLPQESRFTDFKYNVYLNVMCVMYSMTEPQKLQYRVRGRRDYSHNAFEQYLIKYPVLL